VNKLKFTPNLALLVRSQNYEAIQIVRKPLPALPFGRTLSMRKKDKIPAPPTRLDHLRKQVFIERIQGIRIGARTAEIGVTAGTVETIAILGNILTA
jgi:hypothetical protein